MAIAALLAAGRWLVPPGTEPTRAGAGDVVILHAFCAGLVESALLETALLALVAEHPAGVLLAGVHVPRDPAEGEPARVAGWRDEVGASHPILLDDDAAVARALGIAGLPAAAVLDATGRPVALVHGHDRVPEVADAVGLALAEEAASGRRRPAAPVRRGAAPSPTALRRPSGIAVDPARDLLAVADTAHHRVVLATLDGRVLRTTGAGAPGHRDGRGGSAAFRGPRGLALVDGHLYVADTGNDALRRIDVETGEVRTIATGGGLSAPQQLAPFGPYVAIAAAGARQLWAYDPEAGRVGPIAGTGATGTADGPAHAALLDQPTGLAFADDEAGQRLWIGEADAAALRAFEVVDDAGPRLATVAALPAGARPVALAAVPGGLAIADAAGHRILRWSLATGALEPLAGGARGYRDGPVREALLAEPAALAWSGDALYVADAGNHAIRRLDLATGDVETLLLVRLTAPRVVPRRAAGAAAPGDGTLPVRLAAGAAPLAAAAAFDEGGPVVRAAAAEAADALLLVPVPAGGGTLRVQARTGEGAAAVERSLVLAVAGDGGAVGGVALDLDAG